MFNISFFTINVNDWPPGMYVWLVDRKRQQLSSSYTELLFSLLSAADHDINDTDIPTARSLAHQTTHTQVLLLLLLYYTTADRPAPLQQQLTIALRLLLYSIHFINPFLFVTCLLFVCGTQILRNFVLRQSPFQQPSVVCRNSKL